MFLAPWSLSFRRIAALLVVLLAAFAPQSGSAKEKDIQGLAEKVGDSVRRAKLKRVVVADFVASDGTVTAMGRFLAARVSDALHSPKKGYEVIPINELRSVLGGKSLETRDALRKDYLINIAGVAKAVVTGKIAEDSQEARLSVDVVDVKAGRLIGQAEVVIPRAMLPDDIAADSPGLPIFTPGKDNTSYPQCLYCPNPQYTDEARREKFNGRVMLQIVITPEGQASQIAVIKMAGYGLDEQAIAAVRTWRFKPAMKDGNPVAVRAPVEVTYQLK
ncbi:MAG TPA: energy transducer TonB [Candidatus Acidoferrales bacterium]|nr:energy transducer TonB [Candidatus Acidoferrales bacterium]